MPVDFPSELLDHLARLGSTPNQRLQPIPGLAEALGISTGKLREQLEVARELGFIEVRPKTGIRTLPYAFGPGIRTSLLYAIAIDQRFFKQFWLLREHIEVSFWHEAVRLLQPEDKLYLKELVERAWRKLEDEPIQIPHAEHRDLHLTIFSKLDNTFVSGLLEAYWDAYEAVGLNLYTEYAYLQRVWSYHEKMIEAILRGDFNAGYQALVEHADLIHEIPGVSSPMSETSTLAEEK